MSSRHARGVRHLTLASTLGTSEAPPRCSAPPDRRAARRRLRVTQIDQAAAQRFVKQALGDGPRSVKCPSGVEAKPGRTLTCKFVGADGRRYTVVLHIVDGQGRVKFGGADVRPAG